MGTTASASPTFSRLVPLCSLAGTILLIVLHHFYGISAGEIYPSFLLFLFTFLGLAAAGSVHPPLFYAVGKYGTHLPMSNKIIAGLSCAASFALGMWVLIEVY